MPATIQATDLLQATPAEEMVYISRDIMIRQCNILRAMLACDYAKADELITLQLADLAKARKVTRH